jgi:hypothetical protein
MIGTKARDGSFREHLFNFCENRGYRGIDLDASPQEGIYEDIAGASVAVAVLGVESAESAYLLGLIAAAFIPCISLTSDHGFQFQAKVPREYQPRIADTSDLSETQQVLTTELDIFEEEFVEIEDQKELDRYSQSLIDVGSSKGEYRSQTRNTIIEEVKIYMGDQYKIGQAGAVGPGAHAHDISFNQIWQESGADQNLPAISEQLGALRNALLKEANSPEHYTSIGNVASAETEAKRGNGPKMLEYLSKAGKWALDVASEIGVAVAEAAIKQAMQIQ